MMSECKKNKGNTLKFVDAGSKSWNEREREKERERERRELTA